MCTGPDRSSAAMYLLFAAVFDCGTLFLASHVIGKACTVHILTKKLGPAKLKQSMYLFSRLELYVISDLFLYFAKE